RRLAGVAGLDGPARADRRGRATVRGRGQRRTAVARTRGTGRGGDALAGSCAVRAAARGRWPWGSPARPGRHWQAAGGGPARAVGTAAARRAGGRGANRKAARGPVEPDGLPAGTGYGSGALGRRVAAGAPHRPAAGPRG